MTVNKNDDVTDGWVTHRTQRVHWIQRVMMVFMRGPMFLSSTARFPSVKRLRSEPNCIDWSWEQHLVFHEVLPLADEWLMSSLTWAATQISLHTFTHQSYLQVALSSLITYRTVQWMVGQEELHHSLSDNTHIQMSKSWPTFKSY